MIRGDGPNEERAEIIEVGGGGRPLGPIGQRSNRPIAAAAGLVAILGLVAFIGFVNRNPPLPARPSAGPASPAPGGIFPGTVAGLPVIAVSTAQALAANPSGTSVELAVGGWYSAVRPVESCRPSIEPVGTCTSDWQAILESRPDVRWSGDGTSHPVDPGTSTITPLFIDPVAAPVLQSAKPAGPLEIVPPSPLILVGHLRDDRLCGASTSPSALCTSAFVVDAVADPSASIATGASPAAVDSTRLNAAAVVNLVRRRLQAGGFVLGFGALPWSVDTSAPQWVEPSAAGPPVDGRTVWLVRGYLDLDLVSGAPGYGSAIASWMAVDDNSGQVWGPLSVPVAATPPGPEFPAAIDGLPVQSVSEALPSGPGPAGVIAVAGYLSNDRAPEGCPPAPTTDKPNPCSGTQLVLVDQPDVVLEPNDATFLYEIVVPPGLASIQPVILPGTTVPDPWSGLSGLKANQLPRPVVLVGQFGDHRSPQCAPRPGGGNAGCDRSFVVDQIAWIDGLSQGPSIWQGSGRTPVHGWRDVATAVAGWFLPGLQPEIVSISSMLPADSGALTGLALDGRAAELFWVVRVIGAPTGGPATSTFLVFDDRTLNLVEVSAAD